MTRFSKWLIHKLGGYTKEDIDKQPIKYNVVNIQLKTIKSYYNLDEYVTLNYSSEYVMNSIERELQKEIIKQIKPEIIMEVNPNPLCSKRIIAKIELPDKYVKGEMEIK